MDRNVRLLTLCLMLVASMVGLSYASVPLYRIFCQLTGYDGTPLRAERAPGRIIDREIEVRFDANISPELAWKFAPQTPSVRVKAGENKVIHYRARNLGAALTAGTATFNVTPEKAAPYFNKIACFCFQEQALKPGEGLDMGVSFFIDPAIADDPLLNDITSVTLSYTFYPLAGGAKVRVAAAPLNTQTNPK